MSFMHQEVKYRGMEPVLAWRPTQAQPRPGLIEANGCVKRLMARPKISRIAVISCSPDGGLNCVDTSFNPPEVILNNSVYEIAHCGVDAGKPRLFTVIVGKKDTTDFFCHVFKCASKDEASRFVRAVASACTLAFQNYKKQKQAAKKPTGRSQPKRQASSGSASSNPRQAQIRSSMRRPVGGQTRQAVRNGVPNPKLTDSWFRPSMSRGEVATILRSGRIGEFIIRESQTRPGDYAISVQTGNQIWTGLVVQRANGYQLGEKGGVSFADLTDLIAHYAQNTFMNDGNGYPMALKLPDDTAWTDAGAAKRSGGSARGVPDWRQPSSGGSKKRAEPTFEQIMNGDYNPDQEWPASGESSGDEGAGDGEGVAFVPGNDLPTNDQDAFEMFMNQGGFDVDENGELVALDDVADALADVEAGDDDDFVPGEMPSGAPGGGFGDDFEASTAAAGAGFDDNFGDDAPAAGGDSSGLEDLAKALFEQAPVDEDNCISGNDARPLLLKSGLEVATLGTIWMEVDSDRLGKLDFDQLVLCLGLISQAQQGTDGCSNMRANPMMSQHTATSRQYWALSPCALAATFADESP
eukprot:TRINITY_DN10256_c0_g1_i1.p1 TRINITY_DN10256_c0_g1~~TRINITY_DN10256_c0_g1_i1.p1  ORF type:complete len:580 (+),score=144.33 TRINITY_DN10256_c0_g1_i1:76-1815(+)